MVVEVLLFARAAELAGASSVAVELPDGATVADLRAALAAARPALAAFLPRCTVAVGGEFAREGDAVTGEVAVIPPVSGG